MSDRPYSYVPIRYVHDVLSGETLNVGVVLYSSETGFLRAKLLHNKTKRLSDAFRHFDVEQHRQVMKDLESGLIFLRAKQVGEQGNLFSARPKDVGLVMRRLWPDRGTRYTFGDSFHGVAEDLDETVDDLYNRLVEAQMPEPAAGDKQKDDRLWRRVATPLRKAAVAHRLTPEKVSTPYGVLELKHTFRNGKLNILQPLSFDLNDAESITRKASLWYGHSAQFRQTPDIGKVLYAVGAPVDDRNHPAFAKAVDFLRSSVGPQIYLEAEFDAFVQDASKLLGAA